MKRVLFAVMMFLSITLTAQERTTYEQLENNLIKVQVFNNDIVKQKGYLTVVNQKWVPSGVWHEFDANGKLILKVKYRNGQRTETIAYRDEQVIKVTRSKSFSKN